MRRHFILLCILLPLFITAQPGKKSVADSVAIRKTITGFYSWYTKNTGKLQQFALYSGIRTADQPPYKINWPEVEKYFRFLRTSAPQLGEGFLEYLRNNFRQSDSAFKAEPDSEIPFGFDYDWFTNTQEDPEYLVKELKKSSQWVTTVHGSEATVDVIGYYENGGKKIETVVMCFGMRREKGTWKIVMIGCPYKDDAGGLN